MLHCVGQMAFSQTHRDQTEVSLPFCGRQLAQLGSGDRHTPNRDCGGTLQGGGEVLDVRNEIAVWYCYVIQRAIVTTRMSISSSPLWDHVQGGRPGSGGGTDDPELQHVVKFVSGHLETFWSKASGVGRDWGTGGLDVMYDVMLDWVVWRTHQSKG